MGYVRLGLPNQTFECIRTENKRIRGVRTITDTGSVLATWRLLELLAYPSVSAAGVAREYQTSTLGLDHTNTRFVEVFSEWDDLCKTKQKEAVVARIFSFGRQDTQNQSRMEAYHSVTNEKP